MKQGTKLATALLLVLFVSVLFFYSDWLGRWMYPVKYESEILNSSRKHGVDPFLVAAIIRVESNFRTDRISAKKAIGLMQLMPETAEWIIESGGYEPAAKEKLERADVNIELGSWYLSHLSGQFRAHFAQDDPEWRIALLAASYNAGPGNVMKWLEEGVWDGSFENRNRIPYGETRHYVQRIYHYYSKYRDFYGEKWGRSAEQKQFNACFFQRFLIGEKGY